MGNCCPVENSSTALENGSVEFTTISEKVRFYIVRAQFGTKSSIELGVQYDISCSLIK